MIEPAMESFAQGIIPESLKDATGPKIWINADG